MISIYKKPPETIIWSYNSSIFKKFVKHLLPMTHPVTHCTQIYIKLMMDKIFSFSPFFLSSLWTLNPGSARLHDSVTSEMNLCLLAVTNTWENLFKDRCSVSLQYTRVHLHLINFNITELLHESHHEHQLTFHCWRLNIINHEQSWYSQSNMAGPLNHPLHLLVMQSKSASWYTDTSVCVSYILLNSTSAVWLK